MIFSLLFSLDNTLQNIIFCRYLAINNFPIAVWSYWGYFVYNLWAVFIICPPLLVVFLHHILFSCLILLPFPRIMMKRSLFQSSLYLSISKAAAGLIPYFLFFLVCALPNSYIVFFSIKCKYYRVWSVVLL